jgi:2-polyprenyl-3-methyl-5-hydroxy-6-metoxy-1,4-benzoquinol methylase
MAKIYTTEITSDSLPSDNPIHQRLLKAYVVAAEYVTGNVLEVGCGEGRGLDLVIKKTSSFTAVDKIEEALIELRRKFPSGNFIQMNLPPFEGIPDNVFDCVISFQVIEHIKQDALFLQEIQRVLRPGGRAFISTPNRRFSLSRNPWHIREYLPTELAALATPIFSGVEMKGIAGNQKVKQYYEDNRKSVERLMRWDVLDLQHRLPSWILKIPYEFMNRLNRNYQRKSAHDLVKSIHHEDYLLVDNAEEALDLFMIVEK